MPQKTSKNEQVTQKYSESTPSYFAVLSSKVRYCKALEPHAKLLYAELTALTDRHGYCWATNRYFADLYEVDVRTVTRWVSSLEKEGFIVCEYKKEGIQTQRLIYLTETWNQKMFTAGHFCLPPLTKMSTPPDKNVQQNSTFNKTSRGTTTTPTKKETKMRDVEDDDCCCSDQDLDLEHELKIQLFEEHEIPDKIAAKFLNTPYDQVKNAVLAVKQYMKKVGGGNINGLVIRAIEEAWVPNQTKEAVEKNKIANGVKKSQAAENIKKKCEVLYNAYLSQFTKDCYFCLTDTSFTLRDAKNTRVVGYLEKNAYAILEDFIEHELKKRK
jgi:hypothetical protein